MPKNYFTYLFITSFFFFLLACKEKKQPLNFPPYSVGYIPYSEKLDNPDFKRCNENTIIENGWRKSAYKGGVKNIWKYFQPIIDVLPYKKGEDGFLTIRFIMNCKGEKDRYRVLAINKRYKAKEFPAEISEQILEAVKKMPEWEIGEYKGELYDSYNMLTFKIENGKIVDIVP